MKKCFGYVRVSTFKQGEGVSLEAQKDAIEAFAARNDIAISQWFEEKETAAKKGRPIFNRMVRDLKRGKADGLVIHKIDRSARNFADWAKIGDLADAGVDIHFATETLDFKSRGGRLTADIQAVIAADYIRNLREETIKGINGRLKQGLYPWGAPLGYLNNGGGKVKTPDPQKAPLVCLAFELYASGNHSLRSLQKELERRGLRNRQGKPLSLCGLETLLNNPFYCGVIYIKRTGRSFAGKHEPIISVALFDHVQSLKTGKSGKKVTRHNHRYRGLYRCGECGGPMVPEIQKGNVYYRCKRTACPTKTIREEALELAAQQCLWNIELKPSDIMEADRRIEKWIGEAKGLDSHKGIELEITKARQKIDRLTDALIDRLIDEQTFSERKHPLLLEIKSLETQMAEQDNLAKKARRLKQLAELADSFANTYEIGEPHEKRQVVEIATANRIVVGKNVYLEPANWVREVQDVVAVLCGAHRSYSGRTEDEIKTLIEQLDLPTKATLHNHTVAKTEPEPLGRSNVV